MANRSKEEKIENRYFYIKSYVDNNGDKRTQYIWVDTDEVAADKLAGEGFTGIGSFESEQKILGINAICAIGHEKGDNNEELIKFITFFGDKYIVKD